MTFTLTLDLTSPSLSLLPFALTLTLDLHSDAFIYEVPALLSVGQRVSALHPTKGILGVGSVLIVDGDEVRCWISGNGKIRSGRKMGISGGFASGFHWEKTPPEKGIWGMHIEMNRWVNE